MSTLEKELDVMLLRIRNKVLGMEDVEYVDPKEPIELYNVILEALIDDVHEIIVDPNDLNSLSMLFTEHEADLNLSYLSLKRGVGVMNYDVWEGSVEVEPFRKLGENSFVRLTGEDEAQEFFYEVKRTPVIPATPYLKNGDPGDPADGGELEEMVVKNEIGEVIDIEGIYVPVENFWNLGEFVLDGFIPLKEYIESITDDEPTTSHTYRDPDYNR